MAKVRGSSSATIASIWRLGLLQQFADARLDVLDADLVKGI